MASSSSTGASGILAGGALGLAGGVLVGLIMFLGLMRIPVRWFFSVTSTLLLLLAAGLAGQMARFLIQADLLPALASPLWDMSEVLPTQSAVGSVLHVLIGYEASPTGMQMLFYAATLVVITLCTTLVRQQQKQVLTLSKA
jgi:high-affinity iron transporter